MTPQPIETAPKDGGWVLGLVLPDGPTDAHWQPWLPVTWGDLGWHDDDGNSQSPTLWVPIPDPQPQPTGWFPAEGIIKLEEITGEGWKINGQPTAVPWRWLVYIERPNGEMDEYRDWHHYVTLEEAERRALKMQDLFGLPVVKAPLGVSSADEVIVLHPERTKQ